MDARVLIRRAHRADEMVRKGRSQLVDAVRSAYATGLSQREIAHAIGRSQPEVNRLIHFHGTSPHGRALRKARPEILTILAEHQLSHPRVFGSTAKEEDAPDSDIDLLVTASVPLDLLALARIEQQLTAVVGVPVDLVLDHAIRPDLEHTIKDSAVPL